MSNAVVPSRASRHRFLSAPGLAFIACTCIAMAGCGSSSTGSPISGPIPITPVVQPTITVSASTLNFASTISGLASPYQTVTITNTGTLPAVISPLAATGDFSTQDFGCVGSLAVSTACQILVTFNPTATGTRTGTLTVTSNATGSPQIIALSGTATPAVPILSLSTAAVTFGTITTGMSSAPLMITATNLGSLPLSLSNFAITGDFTLSSNACTAALASRAGCLMGVTFTPAATGSRTGTLTIGNNTAAGTQTITLSGTGAAPATYSGQSFQVTVQAGTKAIAGSSLQVYAAGTTGPGSAPKTLLAAAASTSASGIVTVPAGFICPAANSAVYVVSRGGTVSGAPSANPSLALMTAIGSCNSITSGAKFVVDEATTVAAIEALNQFYSVGGSIGTSASNAVGMTNAFATAATLADPVVGTSPGTTLPANAVSPAPRLNSLANLLNACVVSTSCTAFYTATAQGTTLASNPLDALFYLVRNPAHNVAALYTQSLASTAYVPVLPAAPADWTMFVTYSGGGLNSPSGVGVDSQGNVWVSSYFGFASKFTPLGSPVFPNGLSGSGLYNSYGLAIDLNDNAWIPNEQPFTSAGIGSVSEFAPLGNSLAGGSGFINGGLNYPLSVAIDPNGTVWVVDYGNSHLTLLNPAGTPISGTSGYTTPLFAFPVAVALDANHFGWIVNQSSNYLTRVSPDGTLYTNYLCCNLASGIALDQQDNIWVANYFGDTVSLVTNAGQVVSGSYNGGGSIYHPQAIAVDGGGTLWVANYRAPYLTELSGATTATPGAALSPTTGLGADAALLEAYAMALDASGNIWVSNQGNNTLTKFIGLAVPVKTPLSALPQLP